MRRDRKDLVKRLRDQGYIKTDRVQRAMLKVPREEFLPPEKIPYAYIDQPLPIGKGQTISAPHMVAIICEQLDLTEGLKVLEIGTGYGYNAAVVAECIGSEGHLYTIERLDSLAEKAEDNLKRTGFDNVTVILGDGTLGYSDKAPYDRIYGTASAPKVPGTLKKQLKIGGRLLIPVGLDDFFQELVCVMKVTEDEYKSQKLGGVRFVPMIGEHGWSERG